MLKIYDQSHQFVGHIVKYKDCQIESDVATGDKTLSFTYLAKYHTLKNEYYVRTKTDEYVIKEIEQDSDDFPQIVAVLNTEGLQGKSWQSFSVTDTTITDAARLALAGTGWTVGQCDVTKRRNANMPKVTSLTVIQNLCTVFMCEPVFDTIAKTVSFYEQRGEDKGAYFISGLNLRKLSKKSDSNGFFTQIIPIGADGLTINDVNGGQNYLENHQYSDKTIQFIWVDESYTDPQALKDDAEAYLSDKSKPAVSYSADVIDLAAQNPEYSVLSYHLGDTVRLIDRATGTQEAQRIVKMTEYPQEPEKNTCEIANTYLTFEELQAKLEAAAALVGDTMTSDGKIHVSDILNWEKGLAESPLVNGIQESVSGLGGQLSGLSGTVSGLSNDLATLSGQLGALNLTVGSIETNYLKAEDAELKYAHVDLANIEDGCITNAMIGVGVVQTAQIADGAITNLKVAGDLDATKITAGTLSVDRLIIRGSEKSLVYELNNITGALQAKSVETLNGEILTPRTINADRIIAQSITGDEIKGRSITANHIVTNTITSAELAAGAVKAGNIDAGAVTAEKIAAGAVNADKIAAGAVTAEKVATGAILIGNLADAVQELINTASSTAAEANKTAGAAKNTADAASTAAAAAQSTADTASSTANAAKNTADTASSTANAANTAASAAKSTADAVDKAIAAWCYDTDRTYINGGKIYTGTITATQIAAHTITATSGVIADLAITTAMIAGAAITEAKIANLAVTNAKIADATIESAKIKSLDATKITSGILEAARIGAKSIKAEKIDIDDLFAQNITAKGTITGATLKSGSLTTTGTNMIYGVSRTCTSEVYGGTITCEIPDLNERAVIRGDSIALRKLSSSGNFEAGIEITYNTSGVCTLAISSNSRMQAGSSIISPTELGYLVGASSNIQSQINSLSTSKTITVSYNNDALNSKSIYCIKRNKTFTVGGWINPKLSGPTLTLIGFPESVRTPGSVFFPVIAGLTAVVGFFVVTSTSQPYFWLDASAVGKDCRFAATFVAQ